MAITKIKSGKYQVKIRGSNGRWITKTLLTKKEADAYETELKREKIQGGLVANTKPILLDEYFDNWFQALHHQASAGWRHTQKQLYQDYVRPFLGNHRLSTITPIMVAEVLKNVASLGKSEQTQRHVFTLLRKMFADAIELYRFLTFNPVLKILGVKVPTKEARHLNLEQVRVLLNHVVGREFGLAIWLQLFMGLRVGELIALKWSDLDLDTGFLTVRRSYCRKDSWVRKEQVFNEYPKGKKQHTQRIPPELLEGLRTVKAS